MLKDKVIIVTGAGAGIGEGASRVLGQHGARLLLADRDADAAEASAERVRSHGAEAVAIKADVSIEAEVEAMVARAVSHYGRLDGAFNNAGIGGYPALSADQDEARFRQILEIDLIGAWYCARHQIRAMLQNGASPADRGAIVINASIAALGGCPGASTYGMAKAGVVNLARSIGVEYAGQGIRCNAVCPGPVKTPAMIDLLESRDDPEDYYLTRVPMQRFGLAEEIGELVAFLLSDRASFITGEAIAIDGGMSASFN